MAAYVTPAHQHPLGPVMSGPDRLTLLASARAADAVVVEDDYDSEFRYDVAPVPALASLDRERVAYLGTASKSVLPSMRLGWLVPPPALLEPVNRIREATHDAVSWPVQRAFLSLLRDGYVDKVVRSARRVYAARAPRVAAALSPYGEIAGPVAGMYATVLDARRPRRPGPPRRPGRGLRRAAARRLLPQPPSRGGLIVGFGGCTDDELDRALAVLVEALVERVIRLGSASRAAYAAARSRSILRPEEVRRAPQQREDRPEHEHDRDHEPERDRPELDHPAEQVAPLAAQQPGDQRGRPPSARGRPAAPRAPARRRW